MLVSKVYILLHFAKRGSSGASAGASKGSGGGSRAKALPKKKGTAKVIPQQKMTPNEMKTETRHLSYSSWHAVLL